MSFDPIRVKSRRGASSLVSWLLLLSPPVLAIVACADSEAGKEVAPDDRVAVPEGDAGNEASVDAEVEATPCAPGILCRVQTPLELGSISALSGRSSSDVWAGGTDGLMLHWDGKQWTKLDSYLNETLTSIVLTDDEMWGCAGSLVVRRSLAPNSIRTKQLVVGFGFTGVSGIAVLSNGDVYVSGTPSPYLGLPSPTLAKIDFETGLLTNEPDPVHPVSRQASPLAARALFSVPNTALWVVGERGGMARFPVSPAGDAGTAEDAGSSLVGQGLTVPLETQAHLFAAWAQGDELWAAGMNGTIVHYDGSAWRSEETGTTATLQTIFGIARDDIWAAGDNGTVIHFDGERWSRVDIGRSSRESLRAIWGSGKDDVWIGGDSAMFHWGALP